MYKKGNNFQSTKFWLVVLAVILIAAIAMTFAIKNVSEKLILIAALAILGIVLLVAAYCQFNLLEKKLLGNLGAFIVGKDDVEPK